MTDWRNSTGKRSSGPGRQTGFGGEDPKYRPKDVQNQVPAGTTITQVFEVGNPNLWIGSNDPNNCSAGYLTIVSGGMRLAAEAFLDGTKVAENEVCVGAAQALGVTRWKELPLEIPTPQQDGEHDLKVIFRTGGTGEKFGEHNTTLTVQGGTPTTPGNDPSDQDDGGNGFGVQFLRENPVLAIGGGIAGIVAVRTATESAITGE